MSAINKNNSCYVMDVPWVIGISINVLLRIFKFGPKKFTVPRWYGRSFEMTRWTGLYTYSRLMTAHFISIGIVTQANSINDVLKWNFWMSVKSNTLQPRCSNGSHGSRDKRRNFLYVTMVQNTLKIRFWIGNGSAHRINKISPASLIRKWPSRLP